MRPCLSRFGKWEQARMRELGLEDVAWDPERHCEQCIARHAARDGAAAEVDPAHGMRPRLLRSRGSWTTTPAAAAPRERTRPGDKPKPV
ncbi:hypothetical protein [Sorangium cellulosum]|uniref:hypothetical protein n=1 Tax=Sorangium cellulosum TaxID=56 RepID=UPI0013314FF6|nr:hypothetical protein [Sorangium cellulosum]